MAIFKKLSNKTKHLLKCAFKNLFEKVFKSYVVIERIPDSSYLSPDVPMTKNVSHQKWQNYLYENWNKPGMKILEIGSREVTGESEARFKFGNAKYVGFDYYAGKNVDVIGDAHKLSTYFEGQEKFDLIFTSACFEHFAMPWVVALEISKLLKVGGSVFVETHFSFSAHERPWNFFQFSDLGLRALFSPALGFECIEAGMSNPIVGRFSLFADEYLRNRPVKGLYCHSQYLGRKIRENENFDWKNIELRDIVEDSKYPEPK